MSIAPPRNGDRVSVVTPRAARLRGQVARAVDGTLTVEFEQAPLRIPLRFAAGAEVALEWLDDPEGLVQAPARVGEARPEPVPALDLLLVGEPEPVERRRNGRVEVDLDVNAWTLTQATTRLSGRAVNVSAGGALLRLPGLSPFAVTLELVIALPGAPVRPSAAVSHRRVPDLVGVEFQRISTEDRARLVEFVRSR